tara:strand:- start:33 stop:1457 length:1425 start_codon:yes stop_codon:yes gene_type:complete
MGKGSGGSQQTVVKELPEESKPFYYGFGDQFLSQEQYDALSPEEQSEIETVDGRYLNPDYVQGLLPRAQELFTGEMPLYEIAGPTEMQTQAYDLAQSGIGAYKPFLERGSRALGTGIRTVEDAIGETKQLAGQIPGQIRPGQEALRRAAGEVRTAGERAAQETRDVTSMALPFQQEGIAAIRRGQEFLGGAAQAYDPSSAQQYFSPFQQQVVDTTLADLERAYGREREKAENRLAATAISRGAFQGEAGRRRAEAQELEPMEERFQRNIASTIAGLRNQGFQAAQQQAQNAFEQQQRRQMGVGQGLGQLGTQTGQLGTSFGQLGLAGAGQAGQIGMQGAQTAGQLGAQASDLGLRGISTGLGAQQQVAGMGQGLGSLGMQSAQMGGMAQQMGQSDVNLLSQLGAQQQQQQQAQLDATRANAMLPYQQVGFFSDVLQGAPLGTAQTTFAPGPSPFQQATGNAIAFSGLQNAGVFS